MNKHILYILVVLGLVATNIFAIVYSSPPPQVSDRLQQSLDLRLALDNWVEDQCEQMELALESQECNSLQLEALRGLIRQ